MPLITEAKLIKVLQTYNPWWKDSLSIRTLSRPHKRVVYHDAFKIIEHRTIRRFAVISGARRVGKSTILYQMMDNLLSAGVPAKNILYVSFDNPLLKMASVDKVMNTYETLYPLEGVRYLFFDEVQYADNWELWLKVLYDTRPDVKLVATGSSSPALEKGVSDSGTGRWSVLKIPTLSFFEYCELLELENKPEMRPGLRVTELSQLKTGELAELIDRFTPLQQHFNRYLTIGGFPELALADDDAYAQRTLREDVVDKVIKRDVLTLYNIRNPISLEKLFLYLCMTSSEIFNKQTAAKELENISVSTIEDYLRFLEQSNLIYISDPMIVGQKAALKGRPKIYVADAAIRCAVLMLDDVLADDVEMGVMVETTVYKHIVSFYQGSPSVHIGYYRKAKGNQKEVDVVIGLPKEKILCEVKYRNQPTVSESDALVALSKETGAQVAFSFLITKSLTDYGWLPHNTLVPVFRLPALVFIYLLGRAEAVGEKGKL